MAPRGRPRKVGQKRIDAAIDALTPMGFSPALIRQKVKDLLKLYDTDEGWLFIEEASYKLLIESILEDQEREQCEQGEPSFKDFHDGSGVREDMEAEPLEAGPSSATNELICSVQDAPSTSPTTVLDLPPGFEGLALGSGFTIPQKRKPCLGWFGAKDDEDFVLLTPAPFPTQKVEERRRKRKSRWDVGPTDAL